MMKFPIYGKMKAMFQTTNQTSLKPSKHLAFGLLELRHCQPPNLCIRLVGCGSKLELHPVVYPPVN
jgi:hypothetical protein